MNEMPIGPEPSLMSNNDGGLLDEVDILPCPFCGAPPHIEMTGFHLNGRTIRCEAQDCMGPHTTAACINDAVIQWNRRAMMSNNEPDIGTPDIDSRAQETQDIDQGTLTRNLRGLAARMHYRVEVIEQRDGKGKGAIEGQGIGIGYLLAKDLADALSEAATYIEALCQFPATVEPAQQSTGKLLPCPFCDGAMEEVTDEDGHYWVHPGRKGMERADCWLCDAWVSDEESGEGSIGEWNTRATLSRSPAEIDTNVLLLRQGRDSWKYLAEKANERADKLAAQVEQSRENMHKRDDFLVSKGLWDEFVSSLSSTNRQNESAAGSVSSTNGAKNA